MRSHEELEAFDLSGLGKLGEALLVILLATTIALCVSLTLLVLAFRGPRPPRLGQPAARQR